MLFLSLFIISNVLFSQYRIVSLTPSITESLYLLGEQKNVVGITSFCRKNSKEQKVVGSYLEPNIEEIVKLKPDIVFISKEGTRKEIVDILTRFKIKVVVFPPVSTYDDIKQEFLQLASILNKQKIAEKLLNKYENKMKNFVKLSKTYSIVCILSLKPLIIATENSYIGDIIKFAGGKNCFTSQLRYLQISEEELLKIDPEIIILPDMGLTSQDIKLFFLKFKDISAVKNEKIYILPSDILCQPTINNFFAAVEKIRTLIK